MAEYIDREALIAEYDRVHIGQAGGARKLMVDAPAADVVEVKHGKWIYKGIADICSVCGRWLVIEQASADLNYCPHCGAKMDGDKK